MDFEVAFTHWLSAALAVEPPAAVAAFSFNLFESATRGGGKFGVELIGAPTFAPTDSDWACDEIWEPSTRQLHIPLAFSGTEWSGCLARVKALIERELKTQSAISQCLRSRNAVAVGFVDGELFVVWPEPSEA